MSGKRVSKARYGKAAISVKYNRRRRRNLKATNGPTPYFVHPTSRKNMSTNPQNDIYHQFKTDVNMTASELEKWLKTEESKSVGQASGDGESIGHHSGRRIVEILHKKKDELTKDDEQHMHKVHSYVSRHLAQGPHDKKDVETSRWRYSLMNWGHDPLK